MKKSTLFLVLLLSIPVIHLFAQTTQVYYLSGTDKDHRIDWEIKTDRGRKSGQWEKIPVPSNWEFEGFGIYNYGHDWRDSLPKSDVTGQYRYTFVAPKEWKDKTVEIVFEGVMTDAEVKINGRSAGPIHQGGFYRFKYDITPLLKWGGNNQLEVTVKSVSANNSVNRAERDADFWVFGGIYRPVYLEVKPKTYIDRIAVDAKADGNITVDVYGKTIPASATIEAQVFTTDNKPVGKLLRAGWHQRDRLKQIINNPQLWSPEHPNLYQLEVRLKIDSNTVHIVKEKIGFRTVELRPKDGIYVNGSKIKFKGVNRHSAWPTSGRTMSKELSILDVNLMKDMNMNAVRMSHYPPDKHFLEACDSLGLFVIDELTGWQKAYDTVVGKKLVKELITRDVNHPSVILWANGNEGGNNYALLPDYPLYDPQNRVVIHPWNTLGETNTFHYPDLDYVTDVLSKRDKIYFPTEFMHGLYDGGHGAGLEEFWNVMQASQLSAGGFLWVLADEGMVRHDKGDSIDVKGTYAPDGIVGPYREKEASFYTIKNIWSPIHIAQEQIPPIFDGRLLTENRFSFTNLDQCRYEWQLVKFPRPTESKTDSTILHSGKATTTDVTPGLTGYLYLGLPDDWAQSDALYLTATDPYGRHIQTWTWPIHTPAQIAATLIPGAKDEQPATANEDNNNITLTANGVQISISKTEGIITKVQYKQKPLSFTGGPKLLTGDSKPTGVTHRQEGNNHIVEVKHQGAISELRYTLQGDGWLKLDYTYNLYGDYDYAGITFSYPEEKVKGIRWLGNGPFRVWKNRMKGPQLAVHQKAYNNTVTGKDWNYPEFKGYHDRFYWAVIDNEEQPITIVSATDHLFLRLFTPKPSGYGNVDPLFPPGDISFMDGITPIGTKFQKAAQMGPQANKNQFRHRRDRERLLGGTLYFHFGQPQ